MKSDHKVHLNPHRIPQTPDDEHKQTEHNHIDDAHSQDDEPTTSPPADHEHPLFMLAPPATPNLGCDALAAIIDEDAQPAERPSRKRRAVTLGEAQVHLSLTDLGPAEDGGHSPQDKRSRPAACTDAR